MKNMIKVEQLSIRFKRKLILDNVDFCIDKGKIIGIEGPNGCGKTVFLKSLSGFINPEKGTISVFGEKIYKDKEFPSNLTVCFNNGFVAHLSAIKNLILINSIKKKYNTFELCKILEKVGLDPEDKTRYSKFSTGMKQKLQFAQVIMQNGELIILDEILNGLDRDTTKHFKNIILDMNEQGKTIIMTSHISGDLEELCHDIFVIENKKINKKGS